MLTTNDGTGRTLGFGFDLAFSLVAFKFLAGKTLAETKAVAGVVARRLLRWFFVRLFLRRFLSIGWMANGVVGGPF